MAIQSINASLDKKNQKQLSHSKQNQVAFKGSENIVVATMDFIEKGGYPASFIIQDGFGFILPRVGKGILRGSKKTDENGNPVLDEKGKQVREYNWAYARKEGIRELITGPSAFLIPWGGLAVINKHFGRGNNVKLNYIDSFKIPFTKFVKDNLDEIKATDANELSKLKKAAFYEDVFKDVIGKTINNTVSAKDKMSAEEIRNYAKQFTEKQLKIESINADKSLNKNARKEKLKEVGSLEDDFMKLVKGRVGGTVNELGVSISSSKGEVKHGSIGELLGAMDDYFDDALKSAKKSINEKTSLKDVGELVEKFTNRRMGSRIFTNMGLFALVAAFFTQIPKLYNMGLKGNPALKGTAVAANAPASAPKTDDSANIKSASDSKHGDNTAFEGKNVAFTGVSSALEATGKKMFNSGKAKYISDIFELNGPSISGTAMATLLYGFCIPPRIEHAQDKYDLGEVIVRDFTAFTALLFGAKALSRLFSDAFTNLTGLALNKKNMEGKNTFQKILGYLSPNDSAHSVLTKKQLESKYTNIQDYKDGVNGFVDFIEGSSGNIKKALAKDKKIKAATEEIVKAYKNKSFKDATVEDIKNALKQANTEKSELINKFYKLFDSNNALLKQAKTYNAAFGFISTILLVPGLIMWLTNVCERMTERRMKEDLAKLNEKSADVPVATSETPVKQISNQYRMNSNLSMAGFMK